jgi:hypothetical protein
MKFRVYRGEDATSRTTKISYWRSEFVVPIVGDSVYFQRHGWKTLSGHLVALGLGRFSEDRAALDSPICFRIVLDFLQRRGIVRERIAEFEASNRFGEVVLSDCCEPPVRKDGRYQNGLGTPRFTLPFGPR